MELRRKTAELLESFADRLGVSAWSLVVGTVAVVAAGLGGWWAFATPAPPPAEEVLPRADTAGPVITLAPEPVVTASSLVVVHVDGAVARPGVHELVKGARVIDAVEAAGGLLPTADRERLNLAAPVGDGQRVWVPRIGEDEPQIVPVVGGNDQPVGDESIGGGVVNLNTADRAALETLPGVGPSIAEAIIGHRENEGPYERVEDLLEVAGIGPSRLAQLADLVAV